MHQNATDNRWVKKRGKRDFQVEKMKMSQLYFANRPVEAHREFHGIFYEKGTDVSQ